MRVYQTLDQVSHDKDNDTLLITLSGKHDGKPLVWIGREGMYISISVIAGSLEIALRPRLRDLAASLSQLRPTERLSAMRMVGTGHANIELGLADSGELLFRPTIIADATGYFAVNIVLAAPVREALFAWLGITSGSQS